VPKKHSRHRSRRRGKINKTDTPSDFFYGKRAPSGLGARLQKANEVTVVARLC